MMNSHPYEPPASAPVRRSHTALTGSITHKWLVFDLRSGGPDVDK